MFLFLFAVCQLAHYFDPCFKSNRYEIWYTVLHCHANPKTGTPLGGFKPPPQALLNSKLKNFKFKLINTFIANRVDELNVDIS